MQNSSFITNTLIIQCNIYYVLYYYQVAYCYHISIHLYTLHGHVYIPDYAYNYTTLSEWYDI